MLKYTNTLNTKWKKMKDGYQNDLFQAELDENYRWQLRSLIGKVVTIESLDYEIQSKTLESETGEYEVKEILMRNAQVTRVNPYDNESLPLILDHIWIMVGSDLELDKDYGKIKVKGTVGEYLKTSGLKDIGIDAEYCHFNDGKNIVVPVNYQGTKKIEETKEKKEENPVVCPKVFEHMVLNAKECEFLGLWMMYDWSTINKVPMNAVKQFGGPYKFTNLYNKITNMDFKMPIYNYLLKNEGKVFDINQLPIEDRICLIGEIKTKIAQEYRYKGRDGWEVTKYYWQDVKDSIMSDVKYVKEEDRDRYFKNYINSVKIVEPWSFNALINVICKQININTTDKTNDYKTLRELAEFNYITIGEGHIGSYEQELEEYNKLVEEQAAKIKKLKDEYGDLEINVKEIPKPVNKDYTYYYAIPTEETVNLIRWLGKEVPEHQPLTSIPKATANSNS